MKKIVEILKIENFAFESKGFQQRINFYISKQPTLCVLCSSILYASTIEITKYISSNLPALDH